MKRRIRFDPLPPIEPQPEAPRTVFFEEHGPGQYLKVVALGEINETLFDALEAFISRQRKRLPSAAAVGELSLTTGNQTDG